ncbi:MAG: MFS transporter [Firmicutes bacterium]|nr:MFS transporter [Bacillota bacterium]
MKTQWSQRLRLAVGWVTLFTIGTDLFVVSPLLPAIAQRYAILPSNAGLMVASFSLLYAAAAPGFGATSDRIGKRTVIVIGLFGFTVANVLTSFAPSFSWLLVSRGLAGFSAAAVTPSIYGVTGDVAPVERRGRWLAIVGSGLLMALWLGAPIGTFVAEFTRWPVVFRGLAVGSGLLSVVNRMVWPLGRTSRAVTASHAEPEMFRRILSEIRVTLFWGAAVYGFYTFLGTGLRLYDHVSAGFVAVALVAYGMGATVGSLFGGQLADRWGARRVSTGSLVSWAILMALVGVVFHTGAWLLPLLALLSFSGYAFFPAFQAGLAETFSQQRGTAMAWNNTALYVGIALGSVTGGRIIPRSFGALVFVCAMMALLGALFNFLRPREVPST